MQSVAGYILSLVASGILCAVVSLFFEKDNNLSPLIRLVTGVIITIIAIKPLLNIDYFEFTESLETITVTGEYIAEDAQLQTRQDMGAYIIEKTAAYISDEAAKLGTVVIVDVSINNEDIPKPVGVTLQGDASPYVKERISRLIMTDLGICGDNLIWK